MKHRITEGSLAWPAIFAEQDDGRVTIEFRDIPQACTFSDTLAGAQATAADALDEVLAAFIKSRMDIPPPSRRRAGEVVIAPDPVIALKAMVHSAMRDKGITNVAMAAAMGIDEKEVRTMLNPAHAGTKISRYVVALAVCEIEIEVAARSAPPLRIANA